MLSARPGLDFLCIGGPQTSVDEEWVTFQPEVPGKSRGMGVIGVGVECVTDGAVAPTRHIFPEVSFSGRATEVIAQDPRPQLWVGEASAPEENTGENNVMTFRVELDRPATQDVTIKYRARNFRGDTADEIEDNRDFIRVPDVWKGWGSAPELTIKMGSTYATVDIEIIGDDLYEEDETFSLMWQFEPSDPCAADAPRLHPDVKRLWPDNPGFNSHLHPTRPCQPKDSLYSPYWRVRSIGTIINDDEPPRLLVSNPTVTEGSGAEFVVSLDAPTHEDVTFNYATANGTATAGNCNTDPNADYGVLTQPEELKADPTSPPSMTIRVMICDDSIPEPDENFFLEITNVNEHAKAAANLRGTATIIDDEPYITITPNPGRVVEGEDLGFDVKLHCPGASTPLQVTYNVLDGTAEPADYRIPDPRILKFSSCGEIQDITIGTLDDSSDEPDEETLSVELVNPYPVARISGPTKVTGVILDNDDKPILDFRERLDLKEGEDSDHVFELRGTTDADVVFGFSTGPTADPTDIDAASGDYEVMPESPLRIPAGETEPPEPVNIKAIADDFFEKDETFELRIDYVLNAVPRYRKVLVTILDTPPCDVYLKAVDDPEADENKDLTFTITLDNGTPVTLDDGTPVTLDDGTIERGVCDTIPDEGIEVTYTITGLSATEGDDYTVSTTGTVNFTTGKEEKTVTVKTLFDMVSPEANETLKLEIDTASLPDGFGSSDSIGIGTIKDVEPPTLRVCDNTAKEGDDLNFEVKLDNCAVELDELDKAAVVEVTLSKVCTYSLRATPGKEGDPDADYEDSIEWKECGKQEIAAGRTHHTEPVETFSDDHLDHNENLLLLVMGPDYALLADGTAVGLIEDVPPVTVSVSDAQAAEGENAAFSVKLNRAAPQEIQVTYSTSDGTALGGRGCGTPVDYETTTGTLTFDPGDIEKTLLAKTCADDDDDETDEHFFLDLTSVTHGIFAKSKGKATIKPRQPSEFTIADAGAEEGQPVVFTVERTNGSDQSASVSYRTVPLTTAKRPASAGYPDCTACDYHITEGTLTFEPGDASQTFYVPTVPDADGTEAPGETFGVVLSSVQGAAFDRAAAVGTIRESCVDPSEAGSTPPTFKPVPKTVGEAVGTTRFEIELLPALCPDADASLNVTIGAATDRAATVSAQHGQDYVGELQTVVTANGGSLSFDPLTILDDDLDEPRETVTAVLTGWRSPASDNPSFAAQTPAGRLAETTITIVDNDGPPEVSITDASAAEGQRVRFSVRLDKPSGQEAAHNGPEDHPSSARD